MLSKDGIGKPCTIPEYPLPGGVSPVMLIVTIVMVKINVLSVKTVFKAFVFPRANLGHAACFLYCAPLSRETRLVRR